MEPDVSAGPAEGEGRSSTLFLRHLKYLRTRLRCHRKIHLICDNAIVHDDRAVRDYLAEQGDRIVIHFLPARSPDLNPIERIWWQLHEEITRSHRCRTMEALLDLVFEWLEHRRPSEVERDAYIRSKVAKGHFPYCGESFGAKPPPPSTLIPVEDGR